MASVTEQEPFNRYVGNGVTTVFPYEFTLLDADDLVVSVDGDVVTSSNFTLSGLGAQDGGTVTFLASPASGADVLLSREIALAREIDYQVLGDFQSDVVNTDFNRIWQALQGLNAKFGGVLRLPYPDQVQGLLEPEAGYVLGWNSAGDGLQNYAPVDNTLLSVELAQDDGATLVGFKQSGTGASSRTAQDKLRESVSVKDFGAVGDGVVDDAAAIQLAIDYAQTLATTGVNRGCVVMFPPGQYKVGATLTVSSSRVSLRGYGSFHSQLIRSANYGPTVRVRSQTAGTLNLLERIEISGLTLFHAASLGTAMTSEHIQFVGVTHGKLLDLDINYGAYGVTLYGGVDIEISDCNIIGQNTSGAYNSVAGISMYDAAASGYLLGSLVSLPTQVYIDRCQVFGPLNTGWSYGLLINAAENITVSSSYLGNAKEANALIQQTSRNNMILEVAFTTGTYIDGAGSHSVWIDGSAGSGSAYIGTVSFDGIDIKGQGGQTPGSGIFVDGTARGGTYSQACRNLRVVGCRIGDYNTHGIQINGCVNALLATNQIGGNNYNNSASGRGILLGSACDRVQINGGRVGGLPEGNGTSLQAYGIETTNGATNINIDGVDVRNNATGGILIGTPTSATTTSPCTFRVTNCPGYRDGASVPSAPTVPASTVDQYNPFGSPAWVSVFGGTVSDIKLNGQTVAAATGAMFSVGPQDRVRLTYTVAPSWIWWPQ